MVRMVNGVRFDMALYNLKNTHYDLLVKDDSRIAVLGLLGGAGKGNFDKEWKTVKPRRKNTDANIEKEILLTEDETKNSAEIDEVELEEEITIIKPQATAENISREHTHFPLKNV